MSTARSRFFLLHAPGNTTEACPASDHRPILSTRGEYVHSPMFTYVAERKERQISVRIRTVFVLVNACKCAPSSSAVSGAPANRRRARSQPAPSASGSLAGRWRARRPASPNPRSRTPDASPPLSRLCDAEPASLTEGCWRRTRGACRVAQARAEASVLPGEVLKVPAATARPTNIHQQEKRPHTRCGPSLGRKRPRRAARRDANRVSHCTIYAALHKNQDPRRHTPPFPRNFEELPDHCGRWATRWSRRQGAGSAGALPC
ncbi:MAG: hypothetical protein K0S06_4071 [Microvirga sp.]|jgi:hypothetical protein|nr:hypothetical protein [Microvirga sp.]